MSENSSILVKFKKFKNSKNTFASNNTCAQPLALLWKVSGFYCLTSIYHFMPIIGSKFRKSSNNEFRPCEKCQYNTSKLFTTCSSSIIRASTHTHTHTMATASAIKQKPVETLHSLQSVAVSKFQFDKKEPKLHM